jgi:REP element-mobilizing transposase RayT
MPLPKRIYVDNHPYFIVANTYNKVSIFVSKTCCDILIKNIEFYRKKYDFKLIAYCIIPCHLLSIILPKKGEEISAIIGDIKSYTYKQIKDLLKAGKLEIKDKEFICGKNCHCNIFPDCNQIPRVVDGPSSVQCLDKLERGPATTRLSNESPEYLKWIKNIKNNNKIKKWNRELILKSLAKMLNNKKIWQPRFYDHVIRNNKDLEEKGNYTNGNFLKHSLVDNPKKYKYTSWQNYELGDESIIKIDRIN